MIQICYAHNFSVMHRPPRVRVRVTFPYIYMADDNSGDVISQHVPKGSKNSFQFLVEL